MNVPTTYATNAALFPARSRLYELASRVAGVIAACGSPSPRRTPTPSSKRSADRPDVWSPSRSLLRWTDRDPFLYSEVLEHCLITGRTGSGKSSSSGRALAMNFLKQGWSGLVLCAKSSERDTWLHYAAQTNRLQDLTVFSPQEPWFFDPLAFEQLREGVGAGQTESLVALFEEIVQASERSGGASQGSGQNDEAFWRRTLRQLLRNLIDLLLLSGQRVSVPLMCKALLAAPQTVEESQAAAWKSRSFLYQCLKDADARIATEQERHDLEAVVSYWLADFPSLSEKTRSIVCTSYSSAADALNRGILRSLFGRGGSNLTPLDIERGRIVVVDVPVAEWGVLAVIAGVLWKRAFMRSIERRDVGASTRGCFLWIDEAQTYLTPGDAQFISTCRSSRVSVTLLTQNLPVFVDAMGGGDRGRAAAEGIFSNCCTRIHHCNGCPTTNKWVCESVGNRRTLFGQFSTAQSQDFMGDLTGASSGSAPTFGFSESLSPELDPSVFTTLRTGGPPDLEADAIVTRTGRVFNSTGRTWAKVAFSQRS